MKIQKKAAAILTAFVMGFCAAGFPVSAETNADIPKWIPQDFESAMEFRNTYGATHISNNHTCFVFAEPVTPEGAEPAYEVAGLKGGVHIFYREVFTAPEGSAFRDDIQFEVIAAAALQDVYFSCSYTDKTGSEDITYDYTFRTDKNCKITETDIFGWVPDCAAEYESLVAEQGKIAVRGSDIAFCISESSGTAYRWQEADYPAELAEKTAVSDCSVRGTVPPPGSPFQAVHVYHAKQDGTLTLKWELTSLSGGQEPAETCSETFQIVDNAAAVLRRDDAYIRLIDIADGTPLEIDPDNPPVLDVRTELLYEKPGKSMIAAAGETVDPEPVDPVVPIYYQEEEYTLTENPIVLPIAEAFRNGGSGTKIREGTEPAGYKLAEMNMYSQKNGSMIVDFCYKYSVRGDLNFDGVCNAADLTVMQKWLCTMKNTYVRNWQAGDMNADGRLDVKDFSLLRRELYEARKNSPHCTLEVRTTYGGFGVAGQDLGHGEFTESFTVAVGDVFGESMNGHLLKNDMTRSGAVLQVEAITPEGVRFSTRYSEERPTDSGEYELPYDAEALFEMHSSYTVYDGINYSYGIRFSGYIPPAAS